MYVARPLGFEENHDRNVGKRLRGLGTILFKSFVWWFLLTPLHMPPSYAEALRENRCVGGTWAEGEGKDESAFSLRLVSQLMYVRP